MSWVRQTANSSSWSRDPIEQTVAHLSGIVKRRIATGSERLERFDAPTKYPEHERGEEVEEANISATRTGTRRPASVVT